MISTTPLRWFDDDLKSSPEQVVQTREAMIWLRTTDPEAPRAAHRSPDFGSCLRQHANGRLDGSAVLVGVIGTTGYVGVDWSRSC